VGEYPSFAASSSSSVIKEGKDCAEPSNSVSRKDLEVGRTLSWSIGTVRGAESLLRFRASESSVEGGEAWVEMVLEPWALATGCGGGRCSTSIPIGGGRAIMAAGEVSGDRFCQGKGAKAWKGDGERKGAFSYQIRKSLERRKMDVNYE